MLDGARHTPADALALACGAASAEAGDTLAEVMQAMGAKVLQDKRRHARQLYWRGFNIADIARHLDVARTTMQSWAKAEGWNKAQPQERTLGALEFRMVNLIDREQKTGLDFKELDALTRSMVALRGGVPAAHFAGLGANGSPLVPDHVGRLPALGADDDGAFQSAPAIAGGRCRHTVTLGWPMACFNPRPPLLAGDAAWRGVA